MTDISRTPVLVIEADHQVLKLLTAVLSGAGYHVLGAPTAAEALQLGPSRLVLTDDPAGRTAFEPAQKVLHLEKPFRPAGLLRAVRQALD